MPAKIEVETVIETSKTESQIAALSKKMDGFIESTEEGMKATQKASEDALASAKSAEKGVDGLAKGFKGVGLAIKAAGIGLLLQALGKLQEVFMSNQRVADTFAIAMEFITRVFNDLVNLIVDNFSIVTDIFKNPLESVKSLGEAIKNNLIERFESMLEVVGFLGDAIGKVFKGDFKGAMEAASKASLEFTDVLTGVDDSAMKIQQAFDDAGTFIKEYATDTFEAAKATIELANNSRIAAAQQQGLIEQYDREAELQRQIRDDVSKSFEERIAANDKISEILAEQEEAERRLVQIRIESANIELEKDKNNIDARVAQIEALNELAALEARITGQRSEQIVNETALRLEQEQAIRDGKQETADFIKDMDAQIAADDKKRADKQMSLDEKTASNKLELQQSAFAAISLLSGENAELQKGTAIAQATISTFQAINKTLASTGGFGIPLAIATGVFGLAQVASIAATDATTGGGGGGSISAPAQATSNTNPTIGGGFTNPFLPDINGDSAINGEGNNSGITQAYVLQSDIRDQTALSEKIKDRSRI